jgi:hypothetical protein
MVNLDEILLLVIGTLSLGFLNKNGKVPSVQTVGETREFVNPYLDKLQTAQVNALNQLGTSKENLENIRLNNLEIGQNILNIERQRADIDIDFIQSNLDESRSYISQQQKTFPAAGAFTNIAPQGFTGQGLLAKFDRTFNFMKTAWTGEKGSLSGVSLFPDFKLFLTPSNRGIIEQQALYEKAQENIQTAQAFGLKAERKIIDLNNAFDENFGDISRYS